jgi:hypothetical protein
MKQNHIKGFCSRTLLFIFIYYFFLKFIYLFIQYGTFQGDSTCPHPVTQEGEEVVVDFLSEEEVVSEVEAEEEAGRMACFLNFFLYFILHIKIPADFVVERNAMF